MSRQSKSSEYAYILAWVREACEARAAQTAYVERAIMAFKGLPWANFYKATASEYAKAVMKEDPLKGAILSKAADQIPNKGSFVLHNAVETIVASTMGGVGRFEFAPYDPDQELSDKTADLLGSAAKHFWHTEGMDALMPQTIRNAVLAGSAWYHLKYCDGRTKVTLLETSQMVTDPKRFKTNKDRYIGFQQREGFEAIKKQLKQTRNGTVLKTLNEAEVYLSQIKNQINRINGVAELNESIANDKIRADVNLFYSQIVQETENLQKKDSEYTWNGDDIEVTYLYDLVSKKDFMVINRRYVVKGQNTKLSRTLKYKGLKYEDGKPKEVNRTTTVALDHPFVEVPYMRTHWDTYTISPLFYVLDDFDSLCSMESVFFHNLSIMAPITFIGQSSDGELVSRAASVSGEIIDGLPQTFGVLGKAHDLGPITLAIQRYEDRIKRILKATDPMELQAMIGDRATAKEVTGALGQVSQGLNPFIANLEHAAAELGQKFIKLEIIYGNKDVINFVHNGAYGELAAHEAGGTWDVVAKMASSVKLEQESNARKAIELVQYLNSADFIDKREFLGTMIPIILTSLVNREQAQRMVGKDYKPMEEEIIAKIRERAEVEANKHPIDKIDLTNYTDEEIEEMIREFANMDAEADDVYGDGTVPVDEAGQPINPADQAMMQEAIAAEMQNQAGAAAPTQDPNGVVDTGAPQTGADPQLQLSGMPANVTAGEVANDPTGMEYVE